VTSALSSVATAFIGLDISDNMVAAYNARFSGEKPEKKLNAHAEVGNLLSNEDVKSLEAPELFGFDVAAVGLGFHHFENVELATIKLMERLRPGGVLLIIDWLEHGGLDGPATHTVAHHGFSEKRVKQLFESAGLVEVDIMTMQKDVLVRGSSRRPFLAKGIKPVK
jgi:SAM-dependent methyltransferase